LISFSSQKYLSGSSWPNNPSVICSGFKCKIPAVYLLINFIDLSAIFRIDFFFFLQRKKSLQFAYRFLLSGGPALGSLDLWGGSRKFNRVNIF
jgi:hypothetical protein